MMRNSSPGWRSGASAGQENLSCSPGLLRRPFSRPVVRQSPCRDDRKAHLQRVHRIPSTQTAQRVPRFAADVLEIHPEKGYAVRPGGRMGLGVSGRRSREKEHEAERSISPKHSSQNLHRRDQGKPDLKRGKDRFIAQVIVVSGRVRRARTRLPKFVTDAVRQLAGFETALPPFDQ
jgi:hypothetical protein